MEGVSIIIPAYNAETTIYECVSAAINQDYDGNIEVIVVDDGSEDRTTEIASSQRGVQVIKVSNGGAPRATNIGINKAKYDIVISLDSDAILEKDWLKKIVPHINNPRVGAVAGYALTGNKNVIGKIMGYDVELRLDKAAVNTDHLYTMNTAYRRKTLVDIGMFSEDMKIAYDADISRRLKIAGYNLILEKEAKCTHYWRDDLKGFLKQQYNYAYYRIEIANKFKKSQDRVTGTRLIMQVPFTGIMILAALIGTFVTPLMLLLLLLIPAINIPETVSLLFKKKDKSILVLPFIFSLRNLVWIWAGTIWIFKIIQKRFKLRK